MTKTQLQDLGARARLIANEACALETADPKEEKTKARLEHLKQMIDALAAEIGHE